MDREFKVMLAIDPNEMELSPKKENLKALDIFGGSAPFRLYCVHISPVRSWRLINTAEFSDYVSRCELGKNVEQKVLYIESTSRKDAVTALLDYTQQVGGDLIAVLSHGRSGAVRLVLGSFAENLLATSKVPLLFFSENPGAHQESHKILFATDLSASSRRALTHFLNQVKGYTGEIILYHAVSPPNEILDSGVMGVPYCLPESYWAEQRQWVENECRLMLDQIKTKGHRCRLIVQDGVFGTSIGINQIAETENVDLIAMASVSRALKSAVIGSVAKEVFRTRKSPVWVCGPESLSDARG